MAPVTADEGHTIAGRATSKFPHTGLGPSSRPIVTANTTATRAACQTFRKSKCMGTFFSLSMFRSARGNFVRFSISHTLLSQKRSFASSHRHKMLHHLMVGTWTPPGAIFTFQFDDEALTLKLIKKTAIPQDEPISWMTFDVGQSNCLELKNTTC